MPTSFTSFMLINSIPIEFYQSKIFGKLLVIENLPIYSLLYWIFLPHRNCNIQMEQINKTHLTGTILTFSFLTYCDKWIKFNYNFCHGQDNFRNKEDSDHWYKSVCQPCCNRRSKNLLDLSNIRNMLYQQKMLTGNPKMNVQCWI